MKKILTADEMRQHDATTVMAGTPSKILMERAARAVFDVLQKEFNTESVLILCGGGNNGGDGLAVARLLAKAKGHATVCYLGALDENGAPDVQKMSAECAAQYALLGKNVTVSADPSFEGVSAVVDAIFGTGLSRPLEGAYQKAVRALNEARLPVLAVDIPSGVNADNGAVMGAAVRATRTVAIAALKRGHALFPGAQLSGKVSVADIGVFVGDSKGYLLERDDLQRLPNRPRRAHKGSFGRVVVVGGSIGMSGAAHLAAKAAYRAGAGLVEIVTPEENRLAHQIALPEAVLSCYNEKNASTILKAALERADAVAIGMGLSESEATKALVGEALGSKSTPLIVDADALNLISKSATLRALLCGRKNTVVTPHLGEMSRLLGEPVSAIAADLPLAARSFTKESGAITVLKDAHTVIAVGEEIYINTNGSSGMATGGSGDVLSGIIASFAAQGAAPRDAALCGVLSHALAGEAAVCLHGNHGTMASDIIEGLSTVLS